MTHKRGVDGSKNGRESHSKHLGVKIHEGQVAITGNIIVHQHDIRHNAGENVYTGKNYTLCAKIDGIVEFEKKKNGKSLVSVIPFQA